LSSGIGEVKSARVITRRIVCLLLVSFSLSAMAQLPELRDLDLTGWDCATKLEGAAKTPDGQERNRQKNRDPVDLKSANKIGRAHV